MPQTDDRTFREATQHFFRSMRHIGRIAYDAAPRVLVGMMTVRIVQSLMPVATAWIAKLIFDVLGASLQSGTDVAFRADVLPLVLAFGGLLLVSQVLAAVDVYLNEEMGRRVVLHTSQLIYQKLLTFPGLHYFESPAFHDKVKQATDGLQWNPAALVRETSGLIGSLLTLVSFLGVVLLLSPWLALILLVATLPTLAAQLYFRRRRFDMSWENSPLQRKAWYFSHVLSQVRFAKEVRLFNLGDYMLDNYVRTTEQVHQAKRELNQEEMAINGGLSFLSTAITVGTYIFVIAQAFARTITLGDVTLYIEAVRNVQNNLKSIAYTAVSLSERALFFTYFEDIINFEPTLTLPTTPRTPPPLRDAIELQQVSFRYDDDAPYVLRDVSLRIERGKSLALVGLNGAGKTTLVKLLSRFYEPTEGQILWDGVDIREFDPAALRERIGAIFQDFMRYDLSAHQNIGVGDVAHMDDRSRVEQAAQRVGVAAFIETLPHDYDTLLSKWLLAEDGEKGTDLSGGQWQKIAIARMHMREVDLLMLDEPTAALDAEAEHDIYQRFAQLTQDRACVLISHRFSTVRMADTIAVLEDGRIVEHGTHADLLATNGTYARLYGLQAQQYA